MQALWLILLLGEVVMGGPVSSQQNTDSPSILSSTDDDLGGTRVLPGHENPDLEDIIQVLKNNGLELGDDSLDLADMEEVYFDNEISPLALIIAENMLNNLRQIYCGEDCHPDAIPPGRMATPVVRRKKRAIGAIIRAIVALIRIIARAIATGAKAAARATATGVRAVARHTAAGVRTVARNTATARRVLGKVATGAERGTLLYMIIDQTNQLAELEQEIADLRQQHTNANSRQDAERISEELKEKRQEALNLRDLIDQITREFEEENNS